MTEELISVIITVLNGAKWIDQCFDSITKQTAVKQQRKENIISYVTSSNGYLINNRKLLKVEICVFDDASTDNTVDLLRKWQERFSEYGVMLMIVLNNTGKSKGVGYGRNKAIAVANGSYLCFQDIDDEMLPNRIEKQYELAKEYPNAIVGSKFKRIPLNSTCRFSRWANELDKTNLELQIYTGNGPTVIMPTWLCYRGVFDNVHGGFCENGYGTPEDLIFFYKHLDNGGRILRVDECLLLYRYHPEATTFSITAETIWKIRLQHLIEHILNKSPWLKGFTIWNAGKQGRKFFRDLPQNIKTNVLAFCDVDKKKINKYYQYFDEDRRQITHSIPIVHFTEAVKPLIICMKLDLTNGGFETNLNSLKLTEGKDYILFT